jgi:multiple sugar transport system substrate-binding protein
MKTRRLVVLLAATAVLLPGIAVAGGAPEVDDDVTTVVLWAPSLDECDPDVEEGIIPCQVADFNGSQDAVRVRLETAPIDGWTDYVNAGALAGDLPDILYLDGPTIANFAWGGYLNPLDEHISSGLMNDLLPSIIQQGEYQDSMYAVGAFDSGLGIWGNRRFLDQIDARIPTSVDDAWTREEFERILNDLTSLPDVEYAMCMKMNYGQGEWFTYGFSPILQAMGADLIDRSDYQSADGVLNGPAAVEAMSMFQSWIIDGHVDPSPAGDTDFVEEVAALSWVGHWQYSQYKQALGDDLVALPMPILGDRSATGSGSWAWSITTNADNPAAAWEFIEFILQPEEILRMTKVNGAVPARFSAIEQSDLYGEGGELSIFAEQLETISVERPVTPAYPAITLAFAKAVNNIAAGADVQAELDRAVQAIDQDIRDNEGYPF